mmetsp:Transcript_47521/g.111839  ORF Transcript_47521/g.111839 Transcript_47521/m.111839 type:complete len:269 (-) Transcript_47521:153-959(-)
MSRSHRLFPTASTSRLSARVACLSPFRPKRTTWPHRPPLPRVTVSGVTSVAPRCERFRGHPQPAQCPSCATPTQACPPSHTSCDPRTRSTKRFRKSQRRSRRDCLLPVANSRPRPPRATTTSACSTLSPSWRSCVTPTTRARAKRSRSRWAGQPRPIRCTFQKRVHPATNPKRRGLERSSVTTSPACVSALSASPRRLFRSRPAPLRHPAPGRALPLLDKGVDQAHHVCTSASPVLEAAPASVPCSTFSLPQPTTSSRPRSATAQTRP